MRVYFLAEKTCALTVNGVYFGIVDGFERTAELDPADGVFCELSPGGELPVRFVFDEEFLLSPPPQIRLYYTKNAVAVYAGGFLRADQTLRLIRQERFNGSLLTLIRQGKLCLNIENETGFHIAELPDALENCTTTEREDGYLLEGGGWFALLSREGEKLVLSEGTVLQREGPLKAEIPFHDCLAHTAVCEWEKGKLTACSIRSAWEPTEATFALALFESALIGADCAPFLADNLKAKAGSLKEFLGDFRSVVLTAERDRVGLVYERKERVFDVRYYRVELTEGKISNIVTL